MKVFQVIGVAMAAVVLLVFMVAAAILGKGCSVVGRSVNEAVDVAHEQFGPRAMLQKYEQFKDRHAALARYKATIDVFAGVEQQTKETYGPDASKWPKDVRQDLAQQRQEIGGLKSTFNRLASEYNADMAKFNYRFANAGDLPEGATEPLPREYAAYLTK